MNFLEARKAALEGKKVKIKEHYFIYTSSQFNSLIIDALVLDSEWEVVEETKTYTFELALSRDRDGNLTTDGNYDRDEIIIEITTDENGKFIKAENV